MKILFRKGEFFLWFLTNYSNYRNFSVAFKTDLSIKPSILDCGVFDIPRFLLRYKQRVAVISIRIWSRKGLGAFFIDNGFRQYIGEVPTNISFLLFV